MKFGEEWLRKWINPSISGKNICKQLTKFGCEAEYIKEKNILYLNTVIGQIIAKKVYNIDKKLIIYTICICQNQNILILHKETKYLLIGTKVPVILSKSFLKKTINTSSLNLNLNISHCMLGSYNRLYIEKDNHDIIVLEDDSKIGLNFNDYYHKNNYIMRLFTPFNRIDLRSIWGLSREIAILNNLPLPHLKYKSFLNQKKLSSFNCNIDIQTNNIQYIFCELYSIKFKSILPFWIQDRLRRSDILTNNIITNILNYIFMETGHFLHVFDLDKLNKNLFIKSIEKKKIIKTIYNKNFSLPKNTIVLSDNKNILSFEDMQYSNFAEINHSTKNLFLGSICFDNQFLQERNIFIPIIHKKTECLKYNIYPNIQKNIFQYTQKLIIDICGGVSSKFKQYNTNNGVFFSNLLLLEIRKLNKISGSIFTKKDVISILDHGYFSYYENNNIFFVTPPYWRSDIIIVEDLISEIIRIYDYENIKSMPPREYINNFLNKQEKISLSRIKLFLSDRGYCEIISYSFINPMIQKYFVSQSNILKIQNPISNDMSDMRLSLWIGLINCISYNQKRQQESIRIFETGLCFFLKKEDKNKIIQNEYLSIAMSGFISRREWYLKNRKFDFYDLKGDVESILNICGKLECIEFISENFIGLCSDKSAGIYLSGQLIGRIGVLDITFHHLFDLKDPVILFEIMWKKICSRNSIHVKYISILPSSKRDISIIVSQNILTKDILKICYSNISIKNTNINICDVYMGSNIPPKKKSVSICFIFNSTKNTLKEFDINLNILQCITALKNKLGATLRE
ncbi:Phenylalanine--tRNA ligase beta subunit [Buchnera aphidicola (Cinara piceae)]|uniref:Phenylalanine--tRNA ligase beta subunit n=1 Tax=Buchnera aphidicola (Cinara piceae) TaxID=1660043 RepID=A0A803GCP3_9GAMM|nr:phenylalanine--tRNA ligase subunit beta [Buchnera aphidicola]VFP87988.1 Phenylalanine--tRNA ligase beta subunit [Buchnera aphidicola (Cinara piceae)]